MYWNPQEHWLMHFYSLFSTRMLISSLITLLYIIYILYITRDLYACGEEGRQLAVSTFQRHKQFYHSVAANQLTKDLQLTAYSNTMHWLKIINAVATRLLNYASPIVQSCYGSRIPSLAISSSSKHLHARKFYKLLLIPTIP